MLFQRLSSLRLAGVLACVLASYSNLVSSSPPGDQNPYALLRIFIHVGLHASSDYWLASGQNEKSNWDPMQAENMILHLPFKKEAGSQQGYTIQNPDAGRLTVPHDLHGWS